MSYLHDTFDRARPLKPHFMRLGGKPVVVVKFECRGDAAAARATMNELIGKIGHRVGIRGGWPVDYGKCSASNARFCFYCGSPGVEIAELLD
jgi:hypothetical protein